MRVLFIMALGGLLASLTARAGEPRFITYPPDALAASQAAIVDRQASAVAALRALTDAADDALDAPLYSVTDKTQLPASGDPHDYFSFAPYWWPNPDTPDGLPYVHRDGEYNMATKSGATDKQRMLDFASDVEALGLAYHFTGETAYAKKAARQLVHWFVADDTRMNPNMRYAQAIPGRVAGRDIGIIDSRVLIAVADSIELIRPAGVLAPEEYRAVQDWYRAFLNWLLTSDNGVEEGRATNNHGTWYDAQVVAFALFTHQPGIARKQLDKTRERIVTQFTPAGKQPEELARTRPWHYSNFNLQAYAKLARYADGLGEDLWHYQSHGRSLQAGFRFVAGYATDPRAWPYDGIGTFDGSEALGNLLAAAHAYEDPLFAREAGRLLAETPEAIERLLHGLPSGG
ncbi:MULTISPECIES: alginate lyase family protein [unclassified Modicisalibacter]|uniref:alginate lyase family protein n=1 Tax=unclassified Modicisalibacter TaxID=2679913 RepID=UPI001CCB839F|nr:MULTISPECIES: alginate lyase family protein [unclassified Modicisalibacter]